MNIELNKHLHDPYLNVMDFLNEVTLKNPEAISFAPGRPDHTYFNVADSDKYFQIYVKYRAQKLGKTEEEILQDLGQYNKTKGIINDELAASLKNDENILVSGNDVVVTSGAQEAMIIILSTICDPGNDVILVSDPSYIGFTGFAKIFGLEICLVKSTEEGIDLDDLEINIEKLKASGKKPKIVYDIPDFHNPTGTYLSLAKRKQFLSLAEKHNFFIVEDNPYGMFVYEGEKIPTIKSLDTQKRCIYIGSYSKSLYPSLRIGYIVADQIMENGTALSNEMTKVKSLTTVITSSITQAITGGILVDANFSLTTINTEKVAGYKAKWETILNALKSNFRGEEWAKGISWNTPSGGFFLTMNLPIKMDEDGLKRCVQEFGVIFCPMNMFYLGKGGDYQIRLSFSYLTLQKIEEGIQQLSQFLKREIANE